MEVERGVKVLYYPLPYVWIGWTAREVLRRATGDRIRAATVQRRGCALRFVALVNYSNRPNVKSHRDRAATLVSKPNRSESLIRLEDVVRLYVKIRAAVKAHLEDPSRCGATEHLAGHTEVSAGVGRQSKSIRAEIHDRR